jgi:hypothetical protein
MEVVKQLKRSYRVKLIDLADDAQAIWHVRDDKYLELKIFGFNSKDEPVQFVAPFSFESEEKRNETYENTEKLTDFANAVFVTQMANIDPELNTDNFKKQ